MGHKLAASAALAIFVASISGGSWAAGGKGTKGNGAKKDGNEVPDAVERQLSWEEKVVGPKEKGVDHKKIAAMQEKARREDAARQNEPPPKKTRAEGVAAPASSTLPTMDIEKPAPAGSIKKSTKQKAQVAEAPKQRDAIDNILSEGDSGPKSSASSGRSGLNNVFASGDPPRRAAASAAKKPARGKKQHRRN
jgi:hypothetical protein